MTPTATHELKHVPAGKGRAFALMGSTLSFKAEPDDTDNSYFTFEHRMPEGSGVPAHSERNHEAFYVLEGILEVDTEGEKFRLGSGDFLSIPPGTVHALHNPGPGWMRVLTTVSPGAQHARFFATAGQAIGEATAGAESEGDKTPEQIAAIAHECGIDFLAPGGDQR